MKRKIIFILVCSLLTLTFPVTANERSVEKSSVTSEKAKQKAEARMLISRLKNIKKEVEGNNLTLLQKNNYKKEVKSIQEKLKKLDGVHIYLSAAAIILIILLIIIV